MRSLFRSGSSLAGAVFALSACGAGARPAAPASPPAPMTSPTARASSAANVAYPPADRPWTPKDYEQMVSALRASLADGKSALPTLSGDSEALFSRMVSQQNLEPTRDRRVPLDARVQLLIDVQPHATAILRAYFTAFQRGQRLGDELLAIDAFLVHVMARMFELSDEMLPNIEPAAPNYAARMGGLDLLVQNIEELLTGNSVAPGTLASKSAAFWQDVADDWAILFHRIGRAGQANAMHKLTEIARSTNDGAVRAALVAVQKAIVSHPDPDFVMTADELRDATGATLCPFSKDRTMGAPAEYKRNGANDLFLEPLARAVRGMRALRERPVRVVVDANTPYRNVIELMYTLGQSDIPSFEFRLSGTDDPRRLPLYAHKMSPSTPPTIESNLSFATFIVSDGLILKAKGANLAPGCAGFAQGVTVPNRDGKRDLDALAACAGYVKRLSPGSHQVMLTANAAVPFSEVLAVSDAVRGPKLELFPMIGFAVVGVQR